MKCKICNNETSKIFEKTILEKYRAEYYKCHTCEFLQTSEAIWLKEAYQSAITSLDIGLINRNIRMLYAIPRILDACFPSAKIMLDYAGGHGVFTRMMRDEGYNFYHQDIYCENTFAKYFDSSDITNKKFDALTAFEVFEHFDNPLPEIEKLFGYSDNIIFSTVLLPDDEQQLENWWYLSVETGQHIAFYSAKTLDYLAAKFKKNYYRKDNGLHLFTSQKLTQDQMEYALNDQNYKSSMFGLVKKEYSFKTTKTSLIASDYQFIKDKLKKLN